MSPPATDEERWMSHEKLFAMLPDSAPAYLEVLDRKLRKHRDDEHAKECLDEIAAVLHGRKPMRRRAGA